MNKVKVIGIEDETIVFENGYTLTSYHESDCCEHHYLSTADLTLEDFKDLEFDLSNDNFFKKIEYYGIALIPIKGWSVKIPAYGENNGYYSTNLELQLIENGKIIKSFDITECQVIEG